jgi:hypothetical protein
VCVDAREPALIEAHDALFNVQHRRPLRVVVENVREVAPPTVVRDSRPDDLVAVGITTPMRTHHDARVNLATILPDLRLRWQAWRSAR